MARYLVRCGKLPDQVLDPFTTLTRNVLGSNSGNALFQQSVVKALSLPGNELRSAGLELGLLDAAWINDSCDVLVLPYANQFRPNMQRRLEAATRVLRKVRVPVVVVGIGCQTDLHGDVDKLGGIRRAVQAFAGAVLDRSPSIGVRGAITADYLAGLGFRDVDVIGCPSMFMSGPVLPQPRGIEHFDVRTRISVHISAPGEQARFSTGLDRMGSLIGRTVGDFDDVELVLQENRSLSNLLLLESGQPSEHDGIPGRAYEVMLAGGRVRCFVDASTWVEHLRSRDFVIGTRLHGSIAALLAGTPSHLIAHDSRTLELARHHEIPHTQITRLLDGASAPAAYTASDYAGTVSGHPARYRAYAAFLRMHGLSNVFDDGDGGTAFDARLRSVVFPASVSSAPGREALEARIHWVRDHLAANARDEAARRPRPGPARRLKRRVAAVVRRG